MRLQPRSKRVAAIVVALALIGGLGFLCLQLKSDRDRLAENFERFESKGQLLDQKYKEEKALSGRLQRENLTLNGQVRQARMDAEKLEAETVRLRAEHAQRGNELQACLSEKARQIDQLNVANGQLNEKYNDTATRLRSAEDQNEKLQAEVQSLKSELKQAASQNKRYLAHNHRLSQIAKALVGRVEQKELGSSVLVKEPLIQFKQVELENLLQDYLDRIDAEKIVQ
jgi:chromosome segregation ATPase